MFTLSPSQRPEGIELHLTEFTMIASAMSILALSSLAVAHGDHSQLPLAGPHQSLWYNTLPGDGGTQVCFSEQGF